MSIYPKTNGHPGIISVIVKMNLFTSVDSFKVFPTIDLDVDMVGITAVFWINIRSMIQCTAMKLNPKMSVEPIIRTIVEFS